MHPGYIYESLSVRSRRSHLHTRPEKKQRSLQLSGVQICNCGQLMRRSSISLNSRAVGSRSTAVREARRHQRMEEIEQPPMDLVWKSDRMGSIKTSFVPSNISGIAMLWPEELRDCISECGLRGTMYLRSMNHVDRQHGLWLLNNIDPTTLGMRFRDGQVRFIDRKSVVEKLGLNSGSREVPELTPVVREGLMGRVLRLLGEDEDKPGGLTIKMLKEFLDMTPPLELTPAYKTKVKVAYTLLTVSSFLAPRVANPTVSEEAMYIVLVPSQIGEYDLASYTLQVVRESALRSRIDQAEGKLTILACCCLSLLEVFSFDRLQIAAVQRTMYVTPRIAAYNSSILRELIKKETHETGSGKIFGIAETVVALDGVSTPSTNGASSSVGGRRGTVGAVLDSVGNSPNTMKELVSMVVADQTARVRDLVETVCTEYKQIDEQVEADRKRRRSEVNIAADIADVTIVRDLSSKYTSILTKILTASGVPSNADFCGDGAAGGYSQELPNTPEATPIDGAMGSVLRSAANGPLFDEGRSGDSIPGVSDEEIDTLAGAAAQILHSMTSSSRGKSPIQEGPSRQDKLRTRRPSTNNYSCGVVISDQVSGSSGSDDHTVPVWDVSGGYYPHGIIPAEPAESPIYIGMVRVFNTEHAEAVVPSGPQPEYSGAAGPAGSVAPFEYSSHPSILGLSRPVYPEIWVAEFYDMVTYCSQDELERKWYKSSDRSEFGWSIVMSGKEMKQQMMDETEITYHTMAASCRDTNLRDRVMYANEEYPWGALTEPDWSNLMLQIHFLYDPQGTNISYIDELMSLTRIGYNVARTRMIMTTVSLRDSWSLYAFDLANKVLNVLDPLYQGANEASCNNKHGDATKCLLVGLRRCGERHGYGWNVVEKDWDVVYHTTMHPRCSHENTGVFVFKYMTDFDGETVPGLEGGLSPGDVSSLRRRMLYQINTSRSNCGDVPGYLLRNGW